MFSSNSDGCVIGFQLMLATDGELQFVILPFTLRSAVGPANFKTIVAYPTAAPLHSWTALRRYL